MDGMSLEGKVNIQRKKKQDPKSAAKIVPLTTRIGIELSKPYYLLKTLIEYLSIPIQRNSIFTPKIFHDGQTYTWNVVYDSELVNARCKESRKSMTVVA